MRESLIAVAAVLSLAAASPQPPPADATGEVERQKLSEQLLAERVELATHDAASAAVNPDDYAAEASLRARELDRMQLAVRLEETRTDLEEVAALVVAGDPAAAARLAFLDVRLTRLTSLQFDAKDYLEGRDAAKSLSYAKQQFEKGRLPEAAAELRVAAKGLDAARQRAMETPIPILLANFEGAANAADDFAAAAAESAANEKKAAKPDASATSEAKEPASATPTVPPATAPTR